MSHIFTPQTIRYLQQIVIPVRLSCVTESGWPVVLSLWFLYEDGALYCATQQHARVVGYLQQEPRCGYEIAADDPPYCGLRGQAEATLHPEQGADILAKLLRRYQGSLETPLARKLRQRADTEVAIRLDPINCFTWNFTNRMGADREKLCPE